MSKWLIGLSIIQTFAIAFLAARIIELDSRLKNAEAAGFARGAVAAAPTYVVEPQIPADAIIAEASPASPDAELLRRIIREEFAALRLDATSGASPAVIIDPPPNPRLADAARRDLDSFIGRGRIEPKEFDMYLDKIAELPAEERAKALRALTKAMNDGRIEGRF